MPKGGLLEYFQIDGEASKLLFKQKEIIEREMGEGQFIIPDEISVFTLLILRILLTNQA